MAQMAHQCFQRRRVERRARGTRPCLSDYRRPAGGCQEPRWTQGIWRAQRKLNLLGLAPVSRTSYVTPDVRGSVRASAFLVNADRPRTTIDTPCFGRKVTEGNSSSVKPGASASW